MVNETDLKEFSCRDVGMDCDYKVSGRTEEEILLKAEEHGKEAHGITITEEVKDKIRDVIRTQSQAA
jgi:predicted small metal-binding protein